MGGHWKRWPAAWATTCAGAIPCRCTRRRRRAPASGTRTGREYIDYGMGNAALLLGHAPPEVCRAMHDALDLGFHFGNDHPMQLEWAELIQRLVPCAERVRFVNSGSEGSMLALRVARAYTGKRSCCVSRAISADGTTGWGRAP